MKYMHVYLPEFSVCMWSSELKSCIRHLEETSETAEFGSF